MSESNPNELAAVKKVAAEHDGDLELTFRDVEAVTETPDAFADTVPMTEADMTALEAQYRTPNPTEKVSALPTREDEPGNYYGQIRPGELTGQEYAVAEAKLAGSGLESVGLTDEIKNLPTERKFDPSEEEQAARMSEILGGTKLATTGLVTPASEKWKEPPRSRTAPQTIAPKPKGIIDTIKGWF